MAADYGHFADGASEDRPRADTAARESGCHISGRQLTPSFFCRLDDEVVYWNTKRFSG
jgi:hypothetical protein